MAKRIQIVIKNEYEIDCTQRTCGECIYWIRNKQNGELCKLFDQSLNLDAGGMALRRPKCKEAEVR